MEEQVNVEVEATNKRPVFITVLCILTFIGSGLGLLFSLLGVVAAGALESMTESLPIPIDMGDGIVKTIITLLLYGGSLYGAISMWNLKKLGFYIYAIAQVVLLIMGFGILSLLFTAAFIIMYGVNLKHME